MHKLLAIVKRPLILALLVSFLAHLLFFSQTYINRFKQAIKDKPAFTLTLAPKQSKPKPAPSVKPPKATPPKPVPKKPKPLVKKPTVKPVQPIVKPKAKPIAEQAPVITSKFDAAQTVVPIATENLAVGEAPEAAQPESIEEPEWARKPRPVVDTRLPVLVEDKVKPYQQVQMVYDVFADQSEQTTHASFGHAKMQYQRQGQQYTLESLVHATGVMGLFLDDLVQQSRGVVDEAGLKPDYFLYQYGKKGKKTYEVEFDWAQDTLNMQSKKGLKSQALAAGTQDLLSFLFQFMFTPPSNQTSMMITNGKHLRRYAYQFKGEVPIKTGLGVLQTVHIVRKDPVKNEQLALWLAKDYQYLPVKIKKIKPQKNRIYELVIRELTTDQGLVQGDQSDQAKHAAQTMQQQAEAAGATQAQPQQAAPQPFNPLIQR